MYQQETPVKANNTEALNESSLNAPNLKRDKSVKRDDVRDKEGKKGQEAYMQDVPEAAHHDSASTDSVQSVVKISECCRTPIECSHSIQVMKRTEERNADLMTSLAEQSSTKQDQKETPRLLSDLVRSSGRQSPKALNKGRQCHVLLILLSRQEFQ